MRYKQELEKLCRDEDYFLYDVVWFQKTNQKYGILSNFSRKEVKIGKFSFLTAEHLYQILKVSNYVEEVDELKRIENPMFVKNKVRGMIKRGEILFDSYSWDKDKLVIMMLVVFLKVKNNKDVYNLIMKLKGRDIVEVNSRDDFWGVKPNKVFVRGKGKNMLGKIYMFVRDRLEDMSIDELIEDFVREEEEVLRKYRVLYWLKDESEFFDHIMVA